VGEAALLRGSSVDAGAPSIPALHVEALALEHRLNRHTLPFLAGLLGCTVQEAWDRPLAFQVFDDVEDRRDPRLARALFGNLASLAQDLDQRNREGAGIFLAVNGTDGMGRSKAHIQELRAWWTDLDEKAATAVFRPEGLSLKPSLVVRSGHGTHLFWRAREPHGCARDPGRQLCHEAELRRIQKALAAFGADPAVCEVARVMRLPGFWNRKREPHRLVELASSRPISYMPEEIRAAFPNPSAPEWTPPSTGPGHQDSTEKARRARKYAEVLANQAPAISGDHGHRRTLQAAIKIACGFDIGEDLAFQILMEAYNPACQPPWSPAELRRKVQEALRVCPKRGWLLDPGAPARAERDPGKPDPVCHPLKASQLPAAAEPRCAPARPWRAGPAGAGRPCSCPPAR
jgi:hypothetical protein